MKLYSVHHEFDKDDCLLWHVFENATQQIIATFLFDDDATEFANKLENGMGFAGFTPKFVLNKVSVSNDINESFLAEFAE